MSAAVRVAGEARTANGLSSLGRARAWRRRGRQSATAVPSSVRPPAQAAMPRGPSRPVSMPSRTTPRA